ncbi:MAG: hypothetical protein ABL928_16165 [Sphingorhabdus sp.]
MKFSGLIILTAAILGTNQSAAEASDVDSMAAERSCEPGVRTLRHRDEWISKSHAICPFDFAEYNRRLARILERPEGGYSPEYFSGLFGSQPMVQRPEWQPNAFYSVQSAWLLVLANKQDDATHWNSALTAYFWKSGTGGQTNTVVTLDNLPQGHSMLPSVSGCMTQAELFDNAIAAGWEYAVKEWIVEHRPNVKEGLLVHKDGRALTLQEFSGPDGQLPTREQMESKCSAIRGLRVEYHGE